MDTATLTVYSVIIFDIVYKSMYPKMFVDYSSREKIQPMNTTHHLTKTTVNLLADTLKKI